MSCRDELKIGYHYSSASIRHQGDMPYSSCLDPATIGRIFPQ